MKSAVLNKLNYQFKTKVNMKTKTSILAPTKAFFILLVSCCLFSCSSETTPKTEIKNGITYEITIIDGCEYILGSDNGAYNGGYFLSHKGNCKNPIHYQNKVTVVDTVEYQLVRK